MTRTMAATFSTTLIIVLGLAYLYCWRVGVL